MVQAGAITDTRATWAYVLLSLEHCRLMLHQSEIRLLESVLDVEPTDPPVNGLGWLSFEGAKWPVYGLDKVLNPVPVLPPTHRICVLVRRDDGYFGLVCTDVATVRDTALDVQSLPVAMQRPNSPVCGLALHGDQVVLYSTSNALAIFLGVADQGELGEVDAVRCGSEPVSVGTGKTMQRADSILGQARR